MASFVAQKVKTLPAMQETPVWSLHQEDLLLKGMATHSSIVAWRIPWTEGAWRDTVHGVAKSQTWRSNWHFHFFSLQLRKITQWNVKEREMEWDNYDMFYEMGRNFFSHKIFLMKNFKCAKQMIKWTLGSHIPAIIIIITFFIHLCFIHVCIAIAHS